MIQNFAAFLYKIDETQDRLTQTRVRVLYSIGYLFWLAYTLLIVATQPTGIPFYAAYLGFTLAIATSTWLLRRSEVEIATWIIVSFLYLFSLSSLFGVARGAISLLIIGIASLLATVMLRYRGATISAIVGGAFYVFLGFQVDDVPLDGSAILGVLAFQAMVFLTVNFLNLTEVEITQEQGQQRLRLADINNSITRQATQRRSLDETLRGTLDLILENYPEWYHAQVFLIEPDGVQARLVASTGVAGEQLLKQAHRLAVGSLSVIGQTTLKGEPVIARAGEPDTIHRPNPLLPDTMLEAAFPLQVENDIIGVLDLQTKLPLQLSRYDLESFQSLANSFSLAIDSIRQFETARTRIEENQRMAEDMREALIQRERLNQRLMGQAWSEYLGNRGGRIGINLNLETGESVEATRWTRTLSQAVETRNLVIENNVIAVPLRVRGETVGALEFELEEEADLTPEDIELIQEVSDRFGLTAENTRLVDRSQMIAQRETLLNEISTRLQSAQDVESTLFEAARTINETLDANRVVIRLGTRSEANQSLQAQGDR